MNTVRLGRHPSRADRGQGRVRHGGVRSRRANRMAISDRRKARHRRKPPAGSPCWRRRLGSPRPWPRGRQPGPDHKRRKSEAKRFSLERREVVVGDETGHARVGRARSRVDRGKYIPGAAATEISNPKASSFPAMETSNSTFLCTARLRSTKTKGQRFSSIADLGALLAIARPTAGKQLRTPREIAATRRRRCGSRH